MTPYFSSHPPSLEGSGRKTGTFWFMAFIL
jgi:hypothetical protein